MRLALVAVLGELVQPQSVRNIDRREHVWMLGLLTLHVKLLAVLGNRDFPVGSPIPDVDHNDILALELGVVCTLREVVDEYAVLAAVFEVFAHLVHVEAGELLVGIVLRSLEIPLNIGVIPRIV